MKDLERVNAKLQNMDFVQKAPAEVVDLQKKRRQELLETSEKLKNLIETLTRASAPEENRG